MNLIKGETYYCSDKKIPAKYLGKLKVMMSNGEFQDIIYMENQENQKFGVFASNVFGKKKFKKV